MSDTPETPVRGGARKDIHDVLGGKRLEDPTEQPEAAPPRRTRRSRLGDNPMVEFEVMAEYRDPDWDYQWEVMRVYNQEVDSSEHVRIADGGWEAVSPKEMPKMVPAGYKAQTIDRKGQRLYKRPMYLTLEARAEDMKIAQDQKQAKLAQAMAQPGDSAPRTGARLDLSIGPPLKD